MITTAKALTSAYAPMGAMIASDRIAEPFMHEKAMFSHGFTFAGHPVAAAAAMAATRHLRARGPLGHVRAQGGRVPRRCSRACARSRSSATCAAPATSTRSSWSRTRTPRRASATRSPRSLLRGFLSGELFRRGLICRADDRGDPVVQLAPPLIADTEQFEEIREVLHDVLSGLEAD